MTLLVQPSGPGQFGQAAVILFARSSRPGGRDDVLGVLLCVVIALVVKLAYDQFA
ncbi:hypothetical protein [Nonomuraea turkmeniaca]|uniref:hypothetical protein n=1 Tax=Nonomuraea turkmeniaca TaxID=103838 RepID=UPI001476C8B2|nr:hypothetical protein [Nonomuraea turkmeniaca]